MKRLHNYDSLTYEVKIVTFMFVGAIIVGAIVIALSGESVLRAYTALIKGAVVGKYNIAGTLSKATPLIISALGAAVAGKSGIVNLGLQGQFLIGGLLAGVVGYALQLPPFIHALFALMAAITGGILWALPAALMKKKYRVDPVISTIMLNYIALLFTNYMINYPLKDEGNIARTPRILASAELARLIPGTTLNTGIFIALFLVFAVYVYLWKTKSGYITRITGLQPEVAQYAGFNVSTQQMMGFLISGGLAGLAGAIPVLGIMMRYSDGLDIGYGLEGLTVSLLGRGNPIGILIVALLFGAMRSGGMVMERTTTMSREIVDILQAVLIFFVASDTALRGLFRRKEN